MRCGWWTVLGSVLLVGCGHGDDGRSGTAGDPLVVLSPASVVLPGVWNSAPSTEYGTAIAMHQDWGAISEVPVYEEKRVHVIRRDGDRWNTVATLEDDGNPSASRFGRAIAIYGDTVAVGAATHEGGAVGSGAVFVYVRDGLEWQLEQVVAASDAANGDRFGASLALEGDLLVVGAPEADPLQMLEGAVYVFRRTMDGWSEEAKLIASDASSGMNYGRVLDIHGNTIVVGAPGARVSGTIGGAAYVVEEGSQGWTEVAKLSSPQPQFGADVGHSVAIGGEWIAVSAPNEGELSNQDGTVHVFRRVDGAWSHVQQLISPEAVFDDYGANLVMEDDRIVVGSPKVNVGELGRALVYGRSGDTWQVTHSVESSNRRLASLALGGDTLWLGWPGDEHVLSVELLPAGWRETHSLRSHVIVGDAGDRVGESIGGDAELVVTGAPGAASDSGTAYAVARTDGVWREPHRLDPGFWQPAPGDRFGAAVDGHGDLVLVGAPGSDECGEDCGAAFLFSWDGTRWSTQGPRNFPGPGMRGGSAVSFDGSYGAVGAPGIPADSVARIWFLYKTAWGAWSWSTWAILEALPDDQVGAAVANDGDQVAVGAPGDDEAGPDCGAIYLLDRVGQIQGEVTQKLLAPSSVPEGYGTAVALHDGLLAAGAPEYDGVGTDDGRVHLYRLGPAGWSSDGVLVAEDATSGDQFGHRVEVWAGTVAVAAPGQQGGAVYLYRKYNGSWLMMEKRTNPGSAEIPDFGADIKLRGGVLLVGAPGEEAGLVGAGRSYYYPQDLVAEPDGSICASDAHCASGLCMNGVCCTSPCEAADAAPPADGATEPDGGGIDPAPDLLDAGEEEPGSSSSCGCGLRRGGGDGGAALMLLALLLCRRRRRR